MDKYQDRVRTIKRLWKVEARYPSSVALWKLYQEVWRRTREHWEWR